MLNKRARQLSVTDFDNANCSSDGTAEEITGSGRHSEVVVATPDQSRLSRKVFSLAILAG